MRVGLVARPLALGAMLWAVPSFTADAPRVATHDDAFVTHRDPTRIEVVHGGTSRAHVLVLTRR